MSGTKEIKQRIRSVKNTKKITKAMELVAASKMKRAIAKVLASRLYANYSWELLTSLSEKLDNISSVFFVGHDDEIVNEEKRKTLFVLITSNGGLCGAYNSQIIKKIILPIKEIDVADIDIITVGKKGDHAVRRMGLNVVASFLELPDNSSMGDVLPLAKMIIDEFKSGKYEKIYIAYTDFVSALNLKANVKQILPIKKHDIEELVEEMSGHKAVEEIDVVTKHNPYIFEGEMNAIIESLAEKLVRMQIFHMVLESNASEQSSRMMAMKNASEAAGEMIDDLTLVFNKARQSGITQEISEISAGMASVS